MIDDPESAGTNRCESEAQPIAWRIVPGEVCDGIVLSYVSGFNHGTPAFTIRNHRLPIVDAEVWHDGEWGRLNRSSVNWFYPPRSEAEQEKPLKVRFTAIDGATITGSFPPYVEGESHQATSQFLRSPFRDIPFLC